MRVSAFALLVTCVLLPQPVSAEFITLATFNQGTTDGTVGGVVGTTVCSFTTTNAPLSEVCSGSRNVGTPSVPGVGSFSGTVTGSGSSSGGLTLGSSASIDVARLNPNTPFGSGDRYFGSVFASSTITDTLSVLGVGDLTDGLLRLTFDIDGTISEFVDPITLDGFDPQPVANTFFASGTAFVVVNGVSRFLGGTGPVTLDVPIGFAADTLLSVRLQTSAQADILFSEGYRVNVDFANTANLVAALLLDASGAPIAGASMTSANGYQYGTLTNPPVQTVSEPSTLALLAIGAWTAAGRRRRG
jgi:PEP-CTERM motif-containing protein